MRRGVTGRLCQTVSYNWEMERLDNELALHRHRAEEAAQQSALFSKRCNA
jgi:hypothetical protein